MKVLGRFFAILAVVYFEVYAAPHAVPVPSHELQSRSDNSGVLDTEVLKAQVSEIQALLPPGMVFNISKYTTSSPANFASTTLDGSVNQTVYGPQCYNGVASPPNVEDCVQVINQVQAKDFTMELYAGYCGTFEYRSCLAYTCMSECDNFVLLSTKNAWLHWLGPTKDKCVDKGFSGYAWADGDPGWNAGLVNIAESVPVMKPNKCSSPGGTR